MIRQILSEAKMTSTKFQAKAEKLQNAMEAFNDAIMEFQETDESDSKEMVRVVTEMKKMYKPMDEFSVRLEAVKTALRKSKF